MVVSEQIKRIQQGRSKDVAATLITKERSQKLDLLIHLISNLRQSLIICGPKGIGKTTLLAVFHERTVGNWPIISLSANAALSFEKVQEQLLVGITQNSAENVSQSLITLLRGLEKLNRRVVLVCDNAGLLIPGLMTALIQYAAAYPSLRIVFALTDDEIASKSTSDPALNDCHFIEIPALSETQCGEYLQHLSASLDFEHAADSLLENQSLLSKDARLTSVNSGQLFKKTHGIPGKLAEALPTLSAASDVRGFSKIAALVAGGLLVVMSGLWVFNRIPSTVEDKQPLMPQSALNSVQPLSKSAEPPVDVVTHINPTPLPTIQASSNVSQSDDAYRGFGRAQEGDALDEFHANSQPVVNDKLVAKQLKVEIIPVEPDEPKDQAVLSEVATDQNDPSQELPVSGGSENNVTDDSASIIKKIEKLKQKLKPSVNVAQKESRLALETEKRLKQLKSSLMTAKQQSRHLDKALDTAKKPKPVLENTSIDSDLALVDETLVARPKAKKKVSDDAELIEDSGSELVGSKSELSQLKKAKAGREQVEVFESPKPQVIIAMKPSVVVERAKQDLSERIKSVNTDKPKTETDIAAKVVPAEKLKPSDDGDVKEAVAPAVSKVKVTDSKAVDGVHKLADEKLKADIATKHADLSPVVEKFKQASAKASKYVDEMESVAAPNAEKSSPGRYTLQVITFSQPELLENFMRKHSGLGGGLRSIKSSKGGVEKYMVVYGSFGSNAQANAAKQKLPAEFGQAWARKM